MDKREIPCREGVMMECIDNPDVTLLCDMYLCFILKGSIRETSNPKGATPSACKIYSSDT